MCSSGGGNRSSTAAAAASAATVLPQNARDPDRDALIQRARKAQEQRKLSAGYNMVGSGAGRSIATGGMGATPAASSLSRVSLLGQ